MPIKDNARELETVAIVLCNFRRLPWCYATGNSKCAVKKRIAKESIEKGPFDSPKEYDGN